MSIADGSVIRVGLAGTGGIAELHSRVAIEAQS